MIERMCKLYGGDAWYSVKGSKGKRIGTQFAALSLIGYTTPKILLQKIWGKAVENKNGFADLFLVFYCKRADASMDDKEQCSERLDEYPIPVLMKL